MVVEYSPVIKLKCDSYANYTTKAHLAAVYQVLVSRHRAHRSPLPHWPHACAATICYCGILREECIPVIPFVTRVPSMAVDPNITSTTFDPRTSRSSSARSGDGDDGCRILQARTSQQGAESIEARKASGSNRFDAHASGEQ